MSASPLISICCRHGVLVPLPIDEAMRVLSYGATSKDFTSDPMLIEWENGLVEFDIISENCADGEMSGLYLSRFTCVTMLDRLFNLADAFGMMIIWDDCFVTKFEFAEHYGSMTPSADVAPIVVTSSEALIQAMRVIWVNCGPEAEQIAQL